MPDPRQKPTMVRYGVLAFSVSMSVILYLDRMAISVAMPAIAADLNVDIKYVADSVGAFFWCYALFQVPTGWLGAPRGGRRALTLYVVAWSLAVAGLGLVGGLASLIAMRRAGHRTSRRLRDDRQLPAPLDALFDARICQ
ncbi:MAG: MFS transporter [Pirellulales bacterium]